MEQKNDLFSNRPIFMDDFNNNEGKNKPKNKTQFMEMNKKLKKEREIKKKEEDAIILIQRKFKKFLFIQNFRKEMCVTCSKRIADITKLRDKMDSTKFCFALSKGFNYLKSVVIVILTPNLEKNYKIIDPLVKFIIELDKNKLLDKSCHEIALFLLFKKIISIKGVPWLTDFINKNLASFYEMMSPILNIIHKSFIKNKAYIGNLLSFFAKSDIFLKAFCRSFTEKSLYFKFLDIAGTVSVFKCPNELMTHSVLNFLFTIPSLVYDLGEIFPQPMEILKSMFIRIISEPTIHVAGWMYLGIDSILQNIIISLVNNMDGYIIGNSFDLISMILNNQIPKGFLKINLPEYYIKNSIPKIETRPSLEEASKQKNKIIDFIVEGLKSMENITIMKSDNIELASKMWIDIFKITKKSCIDKTEKTKRKMEIIGKLAFRSKFPRILYDCMFSTNNNIEALSSHYFYSLNIFSEIICKLLFVIDDNEFKSEGDHLKTSCWMFNLKETQNICLVMNQVAYCMYKMYGVNYDPDKKAVLTSICNALGMLYERERRCKIFRENFWIIHQTGVLTLEFKQDKEEKMKFLLQKIPHIFSFKERVLLLREFIRMDKIDRRENQPHDYMHHMVEIRRESIFDDAFNQFYKNPDKFKSEYSIHFYNESGEENGIGQGIAKEFFSLLCKVAFDINNGTFSETEYRTIYPNPYPEKLHIKAETYEFLGMIVGKAIYEGYLIPASFSRFFLKKILGKKNTIDDLQYLNKQVYKNLIELKHTDDVTSVGLTFSTNSNILGESRTHLLLPNGDNIEVTKENLYQYISLYADLLLNKQIEFQTIAFKKGFCLMIPSEFLQMFNNDELEVLIGGGNEGFNLNDLMVHTVYHGGYNSEHPSIKMFWNIVDELSNHEKSQLLMFATGIPRAPLMGFKFLNPPFTIAQAIDVSLLPTASTCINMMSLPPYSSKFEMKTKLLKALENSVGFGLA